MIFNSFNFLIIYPLLFLAYYAIPAKYSETRNFYLLLVSYLLYMNFNSAYAIILLSITVVTYLSARMIETPEKVAGGGEDKDANRSNFVYYSSSSFQVLQLCL